MPSYEQQKLLYHQLMSELVEENKRAPLSNDQLAERMGDIFERAFPLSPWIPGIRRYLTE